MTDRPNSPEADKGLDPQPDPGRSRPPGPAAEPSPEPDPQADVAGEPPRVAPGQEAQVEPVPPTPAGEPVGPVAGPTSVAPTAPAARGATHLPTGDSPARSYGDTSAGITRRGRLMGVAVVILLLVVGLLVLFALT